MKTFLVALTLSLTTLACSPSTTAGGATSATSADVQSAVDGKTYAVTGALPDGTPVRSDLSFKEGIFDSSACHAFGYAPGAYTVRRDRDALAFRAEMKGTDGVEVWAGRVTGSSIEGTVTGPDGHPVAFKGQAQ